MPESTFLSDAVVQATIESSFATDAVVRATIGPSFTADAVVQATASGSLTADADIRSTISGSFTANAVIFKAQTGSFTANALVRRIVSGSFTANAVIRATRPNSFTADAKIDALASFVGTPREGFAPLEVQFEATFTNDALDYSFLWDFGDGATSDEYAPIHTYVRPGLFDVSLEVQEITSGPSGTLVQSAEGFNRSAVSATFSSPCTAGNVMLCAIVGMGVVPTLDPGAQAGGYDPSGWVHLGSLQGDAASEVGTLHARIYGKTSIGGETQIHRAHDSTAQTMTILEVSGITLSEIDASAQLDNNEQSSPATFDLGSLAGNGWAVVLYTWGRDHGAVTDFTTTPPAGWTTISDRGDGTDVLTAGHYYVGVRNVSGSTATSIGVIETGGAGIGTGGGVAFLFHGSTSSPATIFSTTETEYISVRTAPFAPYFRDRTMLSIRASFNDERLYNHALVVATGNKAQIYYGNVSDTDPESPTRIAAIGDRVIVLESDMISTQQTANKMALKTFLDNCLVSEDISIDAICNPALEGNDVVGVQETTFSQIERNFRLQAFSIPLSTSRQSMRLARIIDLQSQTISVNEDVVLIGYEQAIESTAGTGVVIDVPAGTEDGDLLLVWAALDGGPGETGITINGSGWSAISTITNKWKKRWANNEPAQYTVGWTGNRRGVVTLMAFRNVHPASPVAGLVAKHDEPGKTFTIPAMTLPSDEYHLIAAVQANDGNVTYTFPSAWTEFGESDTGGSGSAHVSVGLATKPKIGSNPAAVSVTASANEGETRYQIALRKDTT